MPSADKDLVDIIEAESDRLRLPKDPTASLFGQPIKILPGSPDAGDIAIFIVAGAYAVTPIIDTPTHVREFFESGLHLTRCKPELSIKELQDGPFYGQFREPSTNLFYTFAPDPAVLCVVTGKSINRKYAFALDLYTNDANITRGMARYLDSLYRGGIVSFTDWSLVQALFDVDPRACIETWNHFTMDASRGNDDATWQAQQSMSCVKCGKSFLDERGIYCVYCGTKRTA